MMEETKMKTTLLYKLMPALMLVITAFSNGFVLDTRPSPWTVSAIIEKFITEPIGFIFSVH